jgi:hypothetical protein
MPHSPPPLSPQTARVTWRHVNSKTCKIDKQQLLATQKQTASVATILTSLLILLLSVSEEEGWVRPNKTTEKSGHSQKVN